MGRIYTWRYTPGRHIYTKGYIHWDGHTPGDTQTWQGWGVYAPGDVYLKPYIHLEARSTPGDIQLAGRYTLRANINLEMCIGNADTHLRVYTWEADIHLEINYTWARYTPGDLHPEDGSTPGDIHLEGISTFGDLHLGARYALGYTGGQI